MNERSTCADLLRSHPYPGRGILVGKMRDGRAVFAYFIMGRSANSRNRIFRKEGNDLVIKAYDKSMVEDPSLILYYPVRRMADRIIISNGDQTDTIRDFLLQGKSFEDALRTRCFEPDEPHFTPRISALLHKDRSGFSYSLSILKKACGQGKGCLRQFFDYPGEAGTGHLIHTYRGDTHPLLSFEGEPRTVRLDEDFPAWIERLWTALHPDNKISLYAALWDPETDRYIDVIKNKREGERQAL